MQRHFALVAVFSVLALVTGCAGSDGPGPLVAVRQTDCQHDLARQLRAGGAPGASATPDPRTRHCAGLPDAVTRWLTAEARHQVFGGPPPSTSATPAYVIVDVTGESLSAAQADAASQGERTTPRTADGRTPAITDPSQWGVCDQQPAGGTVRSGDDITVTVVDWSAGQGC